MESNGGSAGQGESQGCQAHSKEVVWVPVMSRLWMCVMQFVCSCEDYKQVLGPWRLDKMLHKMWREEAFATTCLPPIICFRFLPALLLFSWDDGW